MVTCTEIFSEKYFLTYYCIEIRVEMFLALLYVFVIMFDEYIRA